MADNRPGNPSLLAAALRGSGSVPAAAAAVVVTAPLGPGSPSMRSMHGSPAATSVLNLLGSSTPTSGSPGSTRPRVVAVGFEAKNTTAGSASATSSPSMRAVGSGSASGLAAAIAAAGVPRTLPSFGSSSAGAAAATSSLYPSASVTTMFATSAPHGASPPALPPASPLRSAPNTVFGHVALAAASATASSASSAPASIPTSNPNRRLPQMESVSGSPIVDGSVAGVRLLPYSPATPPLTAQPAPGSWVDQDATVLSVHTVTSLPRTPPLSSVRAFAMADATALPSLNLALPLSPTSSVSSTSSTTSTPTSVVSPTNLAVPSHPFAALPRSHPQPAAKADGHVFENHVAGVRLQSFSPATPPLTAQPFPFPGATSSLYLQRELSTGSGLPQPAPKVTAGGVVFDNAVAGVRLQSFSPATPPLTATPSPQLPSFVHAVGSFGAAAALGNSRASTPRVSLQQTPPLSAVPDLFGASDLPPLALPASTTQAAVPMGATAPLQPALDWSLTSLAPLGMPQPAPKPQSVSPSLSSSGASMDGGSNTPIVENPVAAVRLQGFSPATPPLTAQASPVTTAMSHSLLSSLARSPFGSPATVAVVALPRTPSLSSVPDVFSSLDTSILPPPPTLALPAALSSPHTPSASAAHASVQHTIASPMHAVHGVASGLPQPDISGAGPSVEAPVAAVRLQSFSRGTPPLTAQPSPSGSPQLTPHAVMTLTRLPSTPPLSSVASVFAASDAANSANFRPPPNLQLPVGMSPVISVQLTAGVVSSPSSSDDSSSPNANSSSSTPASYSSHSGASASPSSTTVFRFGLARPTSLTTNASPTSSASSVAGGPVPLSPVSIFDSMAAHNSAARREKSAPSSTVIGTGTGAGNGSSVSQNPSVDRQGSNSSTASVNSTNILRVPHPPEADPPHAADARSRPHMGNRAVVPASVPAPSLSQHQIVSVNLPPRPVKATTATNMQALSKKSKKPDIVTALGSHMTDSFSQLSSSQRMLVLLLFRVCAASDPRPLNFIYHCVRFHQQGVLDNLDFLGASFLSYSHEHMAPLVAATKVTASTATSAVDVSVSQSTSASVSAIHPRHVACARHRGCAGLGHVRHPAAAAAAVARHAAPALSFGAALETIGASPVFMASSPALGALLQVPLNSPPQPFGHANMSPALGALPSIGASPVLGAQSGSGEVGSPAFGAAALDWSQLPVEMFQLLLKDFGHQDSHMLDGLTVSEYRRTFEELGVIGKGGFGKVVKARKRLDGQVYAVKVIKFSSAASVPLLHQKPMREVQILANLPVHPNICRYYHTWMEPDWSAVEPEIARHATSPPNPPASSPIVSDGEAAAHAGRGGEQGPTPISSLLAANTNSALAHNFTPSVQSSSNPNPTPSVRFAAFPCEPGKVADPLDALNDGWDLAVPTSMSSPGSSSSGNVGGPGPVGGRVVVGGAETSNVVSVSFEIGSSESHCCCCLGCFRHECGPTTDSVKTSGHERRSSASTAWSKKAVQTEVHRRATSWDKPAQGSNKSTKATSVANHVNLKRANSHDPKVAVVTDSRTDASFGDDGDDDEDNDDDDDDDDDDDEDEDDEDDVDEDETEAEPFPIEDDGGFDFSEWPTGNVEDQQQQLGMDSTLSSIPSPTSSTASFRSRASSLLDARSPALAASASSTTAAFPIPLPPVAAEKLTASSRSRSLFPIDSSRPFAATTRAPVTTASLAVPSTHKSGGNAVPLSPASSTGESVTSSDFDSHSPWLDGRSPSLRIDVEKTDGTFSPGSFFLQSDTMAKYFTHHGKVVSATATAGAPPAVSTLPALAASSASTGSGAAVARATSDSPTPVVPIASSDAFPTAVALPQSTTTGNDRITASPIRSKQMVPRVPPPALSGRPTPVGSATPMHPNHPPTSATTALATTGHSPDLPLFYAALAQLSRTMRFPVRLYIQMQLCETDTLATWLQNRNRKIHVEYNMRLWTQIVEGVRHIHENGIIHRDIKPGNIFVEAVHFPNVRPVSTTRLPPASRAHVTVMPDSEIADDLSDTPSSGPSPAPSPSVAPLSTQPVSGAAAAVVGFGIPLGGGAVPPAICIQAPNPVGSPSLSPAQSPASSVPASPLKPTHAGSASSPSAAAASVYTADTFPFVVKIGDFGLAKGLSVDATPSAHQMEETKPRRSSAGAIGTKTYASPEQQQTPASSTPLTDKTDMYSVGLILFEMFIRCSTAMERARAMTDVRRGVFPDGFEAEYPPVASLVRALLSVDPATRPTAETILAHPFVAPFAPTHAKAFGRWLPVGGSGNGRGGADSPLPLAMWTKQALFDEIVTRDAKLAEQAQHIAQLQDTIAKLKAAAVSLM